MENLSIIGDIPILLILRSVGSESAIFFYVIERVQNNEDIQVYAAHEENDEHWIPGYLCTTHRSI